MKLSKTNFADASLLLVTVFWASAYFLIKDIQQTGSAVTLLCYRLGLAAVILGIILFFKKIPLFQNFKYGLGLGLILWATDVPQSIGLNFTKASNTAFIIGLFVIFLPFFNYFLAKKLLNFKNFVSIAIAVIGLWILTGGVRNANLGDWLNLISALAVASHVFFTDKFVRQNINVFSLAFQEFLVVAVLCFFTALIFRLPFSIGNYSNFWGIIYLAIFANLFAYVIQNIAQKHTSTIRVALIFLLEPVFAGVFAWTLGHEPFIAARAFGGLLIFIGMIISQLPIEKWFSDKSPLDNESVQ
jgi:drug/metabolite transporter (DMT)-like permease